MMIRIYCLAILSLLFFGNLHSQCNVTFGGFYGNSDGNEVGTALAPTPENDGMYVVGESNNSVLLLKMDLSGNIIWTRHIDVVPNEQERPVSILVDSDGMIAISGIARALAPGETIFAFRYNPTNHTILWANEYSTADCSYTNNIIQKGPGGNYLLANNPHCLPDDDAEILELNINTGQVILTFAKNYQLEASESTAIEYDGNFIYGVGRYTSCQSNTCMRNTLVKIDPVTGSHIWARMGHIGPNDDARLYGIEMVIDGDNIYSGYWGDPAGSSTTNTKMYLQKTNTDGELIWVNQYELPGNSDQFLGIVKSGNGYVVLAGKGTTNNGLFLFKVDADGQVLWSRRMVFDPSITGVLTQNGVDKIIEVGNQLVFTAGASTTNAGTDMLIIRTDLEGRSDVPCVVTDDTEIQRINIQNPQFYSVTPEELDVNPVVTPTNTTTEEILVEGNQACLAFDTIYSSFDTTICRGFTFEGYSMTGEYVDVFEASNGCDSIRTINLTVIGCDPIIHYDLEACESYMHNGSHMIFTEFVPDYPNELSCADVEANHVDMEPSPMSKHSCTPGVNGTIAMCIGASPSCTYNPGDVTSLIISFSVDIPHSDSVAQITGFEFFEKAPTTYSWIDGPSGPNNYPRFYGVRILKNGTEIFQQSGIATTGNWTLQRFDFLHDSLFTVHEDAEFRIELLPYCPIGNGAEVSVWDIDEIRIFGGCYPFMTHSIIAGGVCTKTGKIIPNTYLHLADNAAFDLTSITKTDVTGQYLFDDLRLNSSYYIKGFNNGNVLQGVSTLDLILMQRHLLGLQSLSTLQQYIAADINHNGSISIIDMIELRKMLLGYYDKFPKNTSWRFGVLPQDFTGTDISTFTEVSNVEALQDGITIINFEGIKIGDVNEDIKLNLQGEPILIRNADMITFHINDAQINKSDAFTMEVTSQNIDELQGFQLALMCNDLSLVSVQGAALPISDENISFSNEGLLRISWNHDRSYPVSENEILFTITFTTSSTGLISDKISVQQHGLEPEAYTGSELKVHELNVEFEKPVQRSEINSLRIEPTPLTTEAAVKFTLSTGGKTVINFFDLSGKLVHSIQKVYAAGDHTEQIHAKDLLSGDGVIYCQLVCNGYTSMQKLVLLK